MDTQRGRVLAVAVTAIGTTVAVAACAASSPTGQQTTTGTTTESAATTTTSSTAAVPRAFPYQPLWPFADAAEAAAWQESHRTGGHEPWHLDADATAVAFTTGYLGFAGVDQVLDSDLDVGTHGDEAYVTVGYAAEEGGPGAAAVLHLARIGAGDDAPWEVVGTRDTTLTLTEPRYGATVSAPVAVGGQITGVDESIRVQVREQKGLLGEACCPAAGGEHTPWTTTVPYQGASGTALTIVVSTGGHVADVERFAITGVRPAT